MATKNWKIAIANALKQVAQYIVSPLSKHEKIFLALVYMAIVINFGHSWHQEYAHRYPKELTFAQWLGHSYGDDTTLFGQPLWLIDRAAKVLGFISGASIILDLIPEEQLKSFAGRSKNWYSKGSAVVTAVSVVIIRLFYLSVLYGLAYSTYGHFAQIRNHLGGFVLSVQAIGIALPAIGGIGLLIGEVCRRVASRLDDDLSKDIHAPYIRTSFVLFVVSFVLDYLVS